MRFAATGTCIGTTPLAGDRAPIMMVETIASNTELLSINRFSASI